MTFPDLLRLNNVEALSVKRISYPEIQKKSTRSNCAAQDSVLLKFITDLLARRTSILLFYPKISQKISIVSVGNVYVLIYDSKTTFSVI